MMHLGYLQSFVDSSNYMLNVFNIEIFYVIISKVGNFIFMKLSWKYCVKIDCKFAIH